jgi:hypothetical protein
MILNCPGYPEAKRPGASPASTQYDPEVGLSRRIFSLRMRLGHDAER